VAGKPLIAPLVVPLFFAAVLVSARYAGRGPGLLAILLSAVTMDYFLVPPALALKASDPITRYGPRELTGVTELDLTHRHTVGVIEEITDDTGTAASRGSDAERTDGSDGE
jgi:hypothetical protein